MSDSTLPPWMIPLEQPPIRVVFRPYDHDAVQDLLRQVLKEFGRDDNRWSYLSPEIEESDPNCWHLDFYFRDPHDAMIFALKYQR